jgi:hypothetical protein
VVSKFFGSIGGFFANFGFTGAPGLVIDGSKVVEAWKSFRLLDRTAFSFNDKPSVVLGFFATFTLDADEEVESQELSLL